MGNVSPNWFERGANQFARLFTGYGGSVLPILGSACLAISPAILIDHPRAGWGLFYVGVALTAVGVAALCSLRPSYLALRKKNEDLGTELLAESRAKSEIQNRFDEAQQAHKRSLTAMLSHVARRALASAHDGDPNHCRISIYVAREDNFALVCRWSFSESLRAIGRKSFPKEQGLIGAAWSGAKGAACNNNLPSNDEKWIQFQCKKYGFPEREARKLTMKSRSISAVRIDGDQKAPVVVIESLEPQLLKLEETVQLREHEPFREIARIISDADIIIPEVHEAFPD